MAKTKEERLEEAVLVFGRVFDNPDGEEVLRQLRGQANVRCGIDVEGIHAADCPDPNKVLFDEGKRALYWFIVGMCETSQKIIRSDRRVRNGSASSE